MSEFSLGNLSTFTLEDSGILISKAVLGADLASYIDVRPGYPEATVAINLLDLTQGFTGASCGWSDNDGNVVFDQITITNVAKSWKMSLCLEDLRAYWMSSQLNPSAFGETLPFEQVISDQMVLQTKKYAESVIGGQIITQVTSANGAALGATAAWSSTTAYDNAIALIDTLPLDVANREDLTMFMSYANFRYLQTNIVAKNLFHYSTGETTGTGLGQKVIIPGTNVVAIPVGGFGTSKRVICGPAKHIIMICGLANDTERIDAWWSRDNQEMRLLSKFTMGVGVVVEEFATNDLA